MQTVNVNALLRGQKRGFLTHLFLGQIWGNLISSTILESKSASSKTNQTTEGFPCGAEFDPRDPRPNAIFKQPYELVSEDTITDVEVILINII